MHTPSCRALLALLCLAAALLSACRSTASHDTPATQASPQSLTAQRLSMCDLATLTAQWPSRTSPPPNLDVQAAPATAIAQPRPRGNDTVRYILFEPPAPASAWLMQAGEYTGIVR